MVHAVESCKRIIRGESSFEGRLDLKLVEMNKTILDDCTQKRERRVKTTNTTHGTSPPRGRQQSRRLPDELDNVAHIIEQIKQKIIVPKYTQEPVVPQEKMAKAPRGRPRKNPLPVNNTPLDFTDNSSCKVPLPVSKQEPAPMQLESLLPETPPACIKKRTNTASSVERSHPPAPKLAQTSFVRMDDELAEVAVSERGDMNHNLNDGQSSVNYREVMSDRGGYSFRKQNRAMDDMMEMSSVNCHSEADPIFMLEEHLCKLAENLSLIRKNVDYSEKNYIYKEVHRFLRNLQRFELDSELLMKRELGKYLSVIYKLLVEIHDFENPFYSRLLPEASNLVNRLKKQLLAHVGLD